MTLRVDERLAVVPVIAPKLESVAKSEFAVRTVDDALVRTV